MSSIFSGEIPIVQLNYSFLAMESPFSRDTVESCVREVLQVILNLEIKIFS